MAFSGIKSLNRIQSVVFDTAYNTNENLLICAPTGAGKTNVALLTILHTVRQHIIDGVIKKQLFKVRSNNLNHRFTSNVGMLLLNKLDFLSTLTRLIVRISIPSKSFIKTVKHALLC